jgi:hypothetical protein
LSLTVTLASVTHLLAFGVADSLLAHSRDEIRQAIRAWVGLNAGDQALHPGVGLGDLRAAYQSLASFVPYEEANAAARLHLAFDRGDYAYLASPAADAAMRRSRRIEQEAGQLACEFDALLNEPVDSVLSEVDAFLNEFERKLAAPSG